MRDENRKEEKLSEAFHLMYDHFPEAALLAHKSKRIVALNPACERLGRHAGMVCAKHGPPESHKGCLASAAVKDQMPMWTIGEEPAGGHKYAVVWLPIEGYPDYYIHFSAGALGYYYRVITSQGANKRP